MCKLMIQKTLSAVYRFFCSQKAFYLVIGLLFIQATWFALTVQYPIAFDESYHLGVIEFYAEQWLPFMSSQPAGSESFGDLTRYTSYMYHYLLSFPFRIIDPLIEEWVVKIIIFRFINIGIFIGALYMLRKLFRKINISEALINFSLLIFVLVPLTPHLAATINYDNLALLVAALFLYFAVMCSISIRKQNTLPADTFTYFVFTGIMGCLVKYPFLPIFAAGIIYVFAIWLRSKKKKNVLSSVWHTFKQNQLATKILLVGMLVLSLGLFIERYGVNYVTYHRQEPTCQQMRPVSECLHYGPWGRNYDRLQEVAATNPPYDPPGQFFLPVWASTLMNRAYFAINHNFQTYDPLPLPFYTAAVVGGFALIMCIVFWRKIIAVDRHLILLVLATVFYLASLLYINIGGYLKYHAVDYGVNGRYLILIMPFLFIWLGLAMQFFVRRLSKKYAHNMLVVLAIIVTGLSLNGGGAQTYLLRSEPFWFWETDEIPVREINGTLKDIIAPVVVGSGDDK